MKKRKDECLFCRSRRCYERVVSVTPGIYDEVACLKHIKELHKHSDRKAPGIMKNFNSSTGKQQRGEVLDERFKIHFANQALEIAHLRENKGELLEALKELVGNSRPGWQEVNVNRETIEKAMNAIKKAEGFTK